MRAGRCMGAAAIAAIVAGMDVPAWRGTPLLADAPDRQRRDGRAQRVVRRKHPVIPVPVFARLRDQIRKPIQELKRRELDDAAGPRLRGFS